MDEEERKTPDEELIRRAEAEWEGVDLGGIFDHPGIPREKNIVRLTKREYYEPDVDSGTDETSAELAAAAADDEYGGYDDDDSNDDDDDEEGEPDEHDAAFFATLVALAVRMALIIIGVVTLVAVVEWLR